MSLPWQLCNHAMDSPAKCTLLPLFYKKTTTPAMVGNGMDALKQAIEFLNPGQIPVTVFNQFHLHL